MRSSRRDRFEALMAPGFRFAWGTLLLALFLLQQEPLFKLALVLLFAFLARLAGKRIRFGYFLLLVASVTLFNLLTPYGAVIAVIGPLRVTAGALIAGIAKGLTVVGLVFASLFTVSRRLVLPGSFGLLLARSFLYYERLSSERLRLRRNHLVEDIDAIMMRISLPEEDPEPTEAERRTTAGGALVALVLLAAVASTLLVPHNLLPSLGEQ